MHQNGNHKTRILNKLFNFTTLLFSHLQNVNICSANLHGYYGNIVLEQSLYKPQNADDGEMRLSKCYNTE